MADGGGTVFISSTCYDLIDIRAELHETLRDLGLVVRLSDEALSDFEVQPGVDSIETCLANVRSSKVFICILDQRYGGRLHKAGYPDVSATHLEFQTAADLERQGKIDIHFYVRDRLLGDYASWAKNERKDDFKPTWAEERDWKRLFGCLDERQKLVAGGDDNWRWPFTTSLQLKQMVVKALHRYSRRAILGRLLERGHAPHLVALGAGLNRSGGIISAVTQWRNVGPVAAIGIQMRVGDGDWKSLATLETGKDTRTSHEMRVEELPLVRMFSLRYSTASGHVIEDDFEFSAQQAGLAHMEHVAKRLLDTPAFKLE